MPASNLNEAWLALIGAVSGGGGLKILEFFLSRGKDKDDVATTIRNELRGEVQSLRDQVQHLSDDLDVWKEKYYDLLDRMVMEGKAVGKDELESLPPQPPPKKSGKPSPN